MVTNVKNIEHQPTNNVGQTTLDQEVDAMMFEVAAAERERINAKLLAGGQLSHAEREQLAVVKTQQSQTKAAMLEVELLKREPTMKEVELTSRTVRERHIGLRPIPRFENGKMKVGVGLGTYETTRTVRSAEVHEYNAVDMNYNAYNRVNRN